ncbi:MAG TPA: alpha/beta fold hydrolase [Acidimicrobiales bacterium]|nr:alpha/beta fold hydrolase [Acidimicrobiales bacterium]
MIPGKVILDQRRVRYAVSDNEEAAGPEGPGSPALWAVNLHGYFAGGGMYWRESIHLAEALGWRVVNPNLPGFAGSDPLPWERVSIRGLTNEIVRLLDHLGVEQVVLLGHSMGGAVAVQFADLHPDRTLGIVYRDGAATPEWKNRNGLLVSMLSRVLPDVASVVDLMLAVVLDTPGLLIGRRLPSTLRGLWPDASRNLRAMGRTLPVGSMIMSIDLRPEVGHVVEEGVPILPVWGCFDRIVNAATAQEFSDLVQRDVVWVPGGHSWMLPRPQAQTDILRYLGLGRIFMDEVLARRRALLGRDDTTAGLASASP